MRGWVSVGRCVILAVSLFVVAGCGGGGSTETQPLNTSLNTDTTNTATVYKASDYSGSWSGLLSGQAFTVSLTGVDATNSITGGIYSVGLSGPFTGSVKADGTITGTVANKLDGHEWVVEMARVSAGLNVTKASYGAATLGTGSCTATPSLTTNMTGSWVGYMVKMNWLGSAPIPSETQNVAVELAYGGGNSFVGAVVSDAGLSAKVTFQVVSGYWMSQIDHAFSWGTKIAVPMAGLILTQNMITSTALMTESFTNSLLEPSAMKGIEFTTAYDITLSNGVTGPTSDRHHLYLVRPGSSLTCPTGFTWSPVANKCSAN